MPKTEYPKMLYVGKDKDNYIVVKDRQEHLEKQQEGYHEHDGSLIEEPAVQKAKIELVPEIEKQPDPPEIKAEFSCGHCNFIGTDKRSLKYHVFKKHPGTLK